MKKVLVFLFAMIILFVAELRAQSADKTFTDERDGKTYKTVKIGTQTWMDENLNYANKHFSCCYNHSNSYCKKFGRLYDWGYAKKACPTGWHLPSDNEWQILIDYLGGDTIAGGKLKSTSGWNYPNAGATNSSGFSALPGGCCGYRGTFNSIGTDGFWWSSSAKGWAKAWSFNMDYVDATVNSIHIDELYGLSVRCLKDK